MRYELGSAYFVILGVVALVFGIWEIVATLGAPVTTEVGWLEIPTGTWEEVWRGVVIFLGGTLIVAGAFKLKDIHGLGKTVLGSIMIWIVAGCDIFGRFLESIASNEATWINSLDEFLATYGPPYNPALWLLPFSLVIIYFIYTRRG